VNTREVQTMCKEFVSYTGGANNVQSFFLNQLPTMEVQTVGFLINSLRWRDKQLFSNSTPALVVHPYVRGTTLRWWY